MWPLGCRLTHLYFSLLSLFLPLSLSVHECLHTHMYDEGSCACCVHTYVKAKVNHGSHSSDTTYLTLLSQGLTLAGFAQQDPSRDPPVSSFLVLDYNSSHQA